MSSDFGNVKPEPDVTLFTEDDVRITCHRHILAKQSHYFDAMFNSHFIEKDKKDVEIKDVNGHVLMVLVGAAYGKAIEAHNEKRIMDLLEVSTMLQFPSIQDRCIELLLNMMEASNALNFFALSDMLGLLTLRRHCLAYVLHHFDKVCEIKDSFRRLPEKLLTLILAHPHLNCKDDEKVIEIANCWLTEPELSSFTEQLLGKGPRTIPLVPCIVAHVRNSGILTLDDTDAVYSTTKGNQSQGPALLMFNLRTNSFQKLVTLSKVHNGDREASGYKICSIGKDVYTFGGEYSFGYGGWRNSVWRWDSFKNSWQIETELLAPRRHHSICLVNDCIYLIGGIGKHRIVQDSVHRYDPANGLWKICAPLPVAHYEACCSYKGMIYIICHYEGCIRIRSYDPVQDKWEIAEGNPISSIPTFSQALSVENDGIYLTGIHSNILYRIRPDISLDPEIVGEFQSKVLNITYVETIDSIVTFTSTEVEGSDDKIHQVEKFDLKERSFSVLWKENGSASSIVDFGTTQTLGCFPLVFYE